MKRQMRGAFLAAAAICVCAGVPAAAVAAFDWPVRVDFQLGFTTFVVPAEDDESEALGLAVVVDEILTDKEHYLLVKGSLVNTGDEIREGVSMDFTVTSYIGIGVSRRRAIVAPGSIPPGGSAAFTANIPLDSEKPEYAMYAVRALGGEGAGTCAEG